MKSNSKVILSSHSLAGTTAVTSTIVPLINVYAFALQAVVTGSVFAGAYQMYISCDEGLDESGTGVTNWATLDSAVTISAATTTIVNKPDIAYRWLKVVFTPNNGTGTLTLTVSTKG